jgi:kynurenine formamidase
MIYLSYVLDEKTPTYGNRNKFEQLKKSDMQRGDVANDTSISTTVHIGTHIDMPYHFYADGQTIESFNADFWLFKKVLFLEIQPNSYIVKEEVINKLDKIQDIGYEILVIKTGICHRRESQAFWEENYGFHPDIADYLREYFPKIRVIGFDSISVSSLTDRMLGREAHRRFLDPKQPILLLEDMDLRMLNKKSTIKELIVSPLRIAKCDGLPCTIFGVVDD